MVEGQAGQPGLGVAGGEGSPQLQDADGWALANSNAQSRIDPLGAEGGLIELYTDGGVIGPNPSANGGVYAWCLVENGQRVREDWGYVSPEMVGSGRVTNNNTELMAVLCAIEAMPFGWQGRLSSDSQVTLGWVFHGWSQQKIPTPLRERLNRLIWSGRLDGITCRLVQGHPSAADLECGVGAKRLLPVSEHNVWCDKKCRTETRRVYASIKEAGGGR